MKTHINTFILKLLLLCLGIQPIMAATHNIHVTGNIEGSNSAAQVVVLIDLSRVPTDAEWEKSNTNQPFSDQCQGGLRHTGDKTHDSKVYFYARIPNSSEEFGKWLFDGWFDENNNLKSSSENYLEMLSWGGRSGLESDAEYHKYYTRTAKWVQPTINSVNNVTLTNITTPTETRNGNVVFNLTDDRAKENYTSNRTDINGINGFDIGEVYTSGSYTFPVTYTASGKHGTYETNVTLTSNYSGVSKTATVSVKEDYTPRFTISSLNFGKINSGKSSEQTVTPENTVYASQNGTWQAEVGGTNKDNFSCSLGANGTCTVTYDPKGEDQTHNATLTLTCTYTDAAGAKITHTETINLSGSGETPEETVLSLKNAAGNTGEFMAEDLLFGGSSYRYPDQFGTVTKTAQFDVSYQYLSDLTFSWTGNDNNVFSLEQGTPTVGTNGKTYTLPITIKAGVGTAVSAETTYSAKLTISGTSTLDATSFTQTLDVFVTIFPKKKNKFEWALRQDGTSFYYIFTDDGAMPIVTNITNTTTPFQISGSTTLANYVTIDTENMTVTPRAHWNSNLTLTVTQPESDEYLEYSLTANFRVRKHTPSSEWIYPGGSSVYLYKNTNYTHFISTPQEQAGQATLNITYEDAAATDRPQVYDGRFRQRLYQNPNGTWGMETQDTVSGIKYEYATGKYTYQHIRLRIKQSETTHSYELNSVLTFQIIKDPMHVQTSPSYSINATTKVKSGLWGNNHYQQQKGSIFKVSEYKATWIGYDWVKNAAGVYEWTGTNTGKKNWAVDTKGNTTGSTNAFALENGGSVVFHFRGIPMYTNFSMYFQTATSAGTVTVEESADGNTWTPCTKAGTSATYMSDPGGKGVWMKGDSRYIRFSYSGSNHVAIINTNIYENTYIRTNFTTNNLDKQHVSSSTYNELRKNPDGKWGTFDFTLKVANWCKNSIQYTSDNHDFELVIDDGGNLASTGLDEYKEFPAHIKYKGSKLVDKATIKLFTRDFYSKTAADTLRSLTFTVNAVGIGADLPTIITNATKNTTYMTGTVGPYLNTATQLEETSYLYSQTRGNNPHTGLSENDFSACFGTDGNPLFDSLYIFGTTTNTDNATHKYTYYYKDSEGNVQSASGTFPKISAAAATAPCNAITPCYVYTRNGKQYNLMRTIANMNVAKKPIGTITANGQKIYFSGFCPSISTGYQASDMGAIHVKGGSNATIDIYIENCELTSRSKSETGYSTPDQITYSSAWDLTVGGGVHIAGSGAVMVFQPTSTTAFKPTIHLKGTNYLKSNQGMKIHVDVLGKTANAVQSSSPIHLYPGNTDNICNLTIDDNWLTTASASTRVNGSLKLRRVTNQTPSIDLGNGKTSVTFNGGQYFFQSSIPSSDEYISTLTFSYRMYDLAGIAKMYGLGEDQKDGKVYFNDGTFNVLPISMTSTDPYYGFYRNRTSIKCPIGVQVNGGSYNASVWEADGPNDVGASPKNAAGEQCYPYRAKANTIDPVTGLCTDVNNLPAEVQTYWDTYYHHSSLTPNTDDSVTLMFPATLLGKTPYAHKYVTPWVLSCTKITVASGSGNASIGGNQTAPSNPQTNQINYLLWTNIDNYIRNASKNGYETPAIGNMDVSASVSVDNANYAQIANSEDYEVRMKMYYMTTVTADIWMSFCAPFDISNVYVFDTYPSQALEEEMTRSEALATQGTSNLDLAYAIGNYIQGSGNSIRDLNYFVAAFQKYGYGQDTTSGHYPKNANIDSKTGKPYYPKNYTSAKGYTKEYRTQTPLVAYNGKNANSAHYFLYHSRAKEWAYDGTAFKTDWELVTPVTKVIGEDERTVLMQQGEIYAMQFPYCSGCDDPATRDYYDYWTGKFILFEGYGPQTLRGKNAHSSLTAAYNTPNMGSLRGNLTLADVTANNSNTYRQADGKNNFEASTGTVMPGGVFMLANGAARAGKIAHVDVFSGDVTYSDEEGTTGLQTLARDHTLLVGTTEHQLIITALVPQQVAVYTASGQLIAQQYLDGELRLYLPQGMYLVRGEKDEAKAVVR